MSEQKTCFKRVDYDLSSLLNYIDIGDIGLPDIQRPFVWKNSKVRDLFDSMYRGFPVGYLLFWENTETTGIKQIGIDGKLHAVPQRLIVDGQQRLTSLYAVFRGKPVIDDNYTKRKIEIAFRPRDGRFEVLDAVIRKDPEWIPNISDLWTSGKSSYQMVKGFLAGLKNEDSLTDEEEEQLSHNLDKLFDLQKYPFTALEIAPTVDEEQVADIFVRINSDGVKLNQADFILTLLSVFWDAGRAALEDFCRASRRPAASSDAPSPFNHFIEPDPDQMLRVAIALGFRRGRLKSVYQVLRGKDMATDTFSESRREQQFDILRQAQADVLDLKHWHLFLNSLTSAGFRSSAMISSQNALLFTYAFYLIGRLRCHVSEHVLEKLVSRWFFFSSLTGRYTSSPETVMDADLNRVGNLTDAQEFERVLTETMASTLTNDYWLTTLPASLESSAARSPELFAYVAAQNILNAPVLFSNKKIADMLDPAIKATKNALERHHLFPKAWLEAQGLTDRKVTNQLANYALVEWPENIAIGDKPPGAYVPELQPRFSPAEWRTMHEFHALPLGWEQMGYREFLSERRKLMAAIIRRGFECL